MFNLMRIFMFFIPPSKIGIYKSQKANKKNIYL